VTAARLGISESAMVNNVVVAIKVSVCRVHLDRRFTSTRELTP
jgi:hypothetical protein